MLLQQQITKGVIELMEQGWLPDVLIRAGIRKLCHERLQSLRLLDEGHKVKLFQQARCGPIALVPEKANEQHYELPAKFFTKILGLQRKYSCCYWDKQITSLDEAEREALRQTCIHAQLHDGVRVLELGCGWGALSLWIAEQYPNSHITAVSNSRAQRIHIEAEASRRRVADRLRVVTADMNQFDSATTFDRIISVEMFEHMRNYKWLMRRISSWLTAEGKLLVHVFCHRTTPYLFETHGAVNWMGRYFFTGGIMPSADMLSAFNDDLQVIEQWTWNGKHYQRTAEQWLRNLDDNYVEVLAILRTTYGPTLAKRWLQRWRIFFLAVSELFGYQEGEEWFVSHYLFEPVARSKAAASSASARSTHS